MRAIRAISMAAVAAVAAAGLVTVPTAPVEADPAPTIGAPQLSSPTADVPTTISVPVGDPGGSVELHVTVGFDEPVVQELLDDGTGADAVAGDGTFTGVIAAQPAGSLVRYRVVAGPSVWPVPEGKRRQEGFVVDRAPVTTALPVLDWYLAPVDDQWLQDNRGSKAYVPAVLVVDGEVLDGVEVRNQGGFTSMLSPKPNFKFKLPGQRVLGAPLFEDPVDEFVADADFEDPTYSIGDAAQHLFEAAGVPVRSTGVARVERNGAFYGVYQLYEELDGTWVDRLGFPVGSMYESENGVGGLLIDEGSVEQLAAGWSEESGDGTYHDLLALVAAVDRTAGQARAAAVVDRFDLPRLVDLLAMATLLQHTDTARTNLTLVSDQRDGRWRVVPNDLDLVLGLRGRVRVEGMLPLPLLGTTSALLQGSELGQAVSRRLRSLYDEHFAHDGLHESVVARADRLRADVAEDQALWQLPLPTLDEGVADLADYLDHLRREVATATAAGVIPSTQDPSATARFSEVLASGTSGDFVELANPDPHQAVDLSGWRLAGAATATLPGGSVIPAGGRMVVPVAPEVIAQRQDGVLVAGRLDAALPTTGGTITLVDDAEAPRDAITWGVGGDWPAPGTSGRSLEARSLDEGRAAPSGWQLSPVAGGTPGDAGASAQGLVVQAWTGTLEARLGETVPMQVTVTNHGPAAATGVVLAGPGTSCDASLGTIAAGAVGTVWCEVTRDDLGISPTALALGTVALQATSDQQTDGVGTVVYLLASFPIPGAPAVEVTEARLRPGQLEVGHRLDAYGDMVDALGPPRLEQHFVPLAGGEAFAAQVDSGTTPPPSPLLTTPPVGVRGVARWAIRAGMGPIWASTFTPPLTVRGTATWPFSGGTALVDRWFLDLVGRAPTAGERTLWGTFIADGGHPADLATLLLAEPRWTEDVAPLVRLYLAHFGRAPDATGLRYWVGRRRAGVTLTRISDQFVGSSEFARRYAGLGSEAFVDAVYLNVFGRASDPSGRAYWARRVDAGYPRGAVVLAFSESSEGIRLKAPEVDSLVAWFALHGSVPGDDWQDRAADWLRQGGDLGTVVESARSDDRYADVVG